MTPEILNVTNEGAKHRVTFRFVSATGEIDGPRVEDRPADEDHAAWAEAIKPAEAVDYRAAIRGLLGAATYDALRTALADEGVDLVQIGPAALDVTASPVAPYDLGAALSERLGAEVYESIKSHLRAAGFSTALATFKPEAVAL